MVDQQTCRSRRWRRKRRTAILGQVKIEKDGGRLRGNIGEGPGIYFYIFYVDPPSTIVFDSQLNVNFAPIADPLSGKFG
jgi:hypothetical protein